MARIKVQRAEPHNRSTHWAIVDETIPDGFIVTDFGRYPKSVLLINWVSPNQETDPPAPWFVEEFFKAMLGLKK